MKGFAVICALVATHAVIMPSQAYADVMAVGANGAEWIAGGVQQTSVPEAMVIDTLSGIGFVGGANEEVQNAAIASHDENVSLPVEQAFVKQSYTQANDTAGPTQWRAHVAAMAAKYDISPTLLDALVWQESRWNERAVSPVGARGLAQLMPSTAADLGVNSSDPKANLEGGARYLRQQLDTFGGNIEKALAAYNAGPGRVVKAGGVPNIRETRLYVASIMARLAAPVKQ